MSAKIIYGFKIDQNVIESYYKLDCCQFVSLSESLSDFESGLDKTDDDDITIENVDFEHSSDDNKGGDDCLIIGVVMN